jgi:hypothetical protein
MHISSGLLFMWDVVSSFQKLSHKKPDFGTPKMKNTLFMGRNRKRPPWHFSPSQEPHTCSIWDYINILKNIFFGIF